MRTVGGGGGGEVLILGDMNARTLDESDYIILKKLSG